MRVHEIRLHVHAADQPTILELEREGALLPDESAVRVYAGDEPQPVLMAAAVPALADGIHPIFPLVAQPERFKVVVPWWVEQVTFKLTGPCESVPIAREDGEKYEVTIWRSTGRRTGRVWEVWP